MKKEVQKRQGKVLKFLDDNPRTVRFVLSDESVDRHNSIIPVKAWNLDSIKNNPIAGWSHGVYGGSFFNRTPNPDDFIGTWDVKVDGKELIGDLTFEDEETNPKADKLLRKVKNGTLSSVSVGFLPHKQHTGDSEKTEGEVDGVTYYDEAELVEASLVGIPSNKNARKKDFEDIGIDISELIEELIKEALGDEFNEKLTLRGLFATLRGGDADEVEKADDEILIGGDIDTDLIGKDEARIEREKEYYNKLIELL